MFFAVHSDPLPVSLEAVDVVVDPLQGHSHVLEWNKKNSIETKSQNVILKNKNIYQKTVVSWSVVVASGEKTKSTKSEI